MGAKLSGQEIKRRLIELTNLRRLYANSKKTIAKLKDSLKAKDEELKAKTAEIAAQATELQQQAMRIADLEKAVFGRSKKQTFRAKFSKPKQPKKVREPSSYRRPRPEESEITSVERLCLPSTCSCDGDLKVTDVVDRYLIDIPLPNLTPNYQHKLVTKYQIEKGLCQKCGLSQTAGGYDLGGQEVKLGLNVKLLVASLVSSGLSYQQTLRLLKILYGLKVSSGEVSKIMSWANRRWQPAYQNLLQSIRASPQAFIDETPWAIRDQNGAGYAWIMVDDQNQLAFAFENNRGLAQAKKLLQGFEGVRITDNYAAYSNKSFKGEHQLCWAHLYRTIRDLKNNKNLPQNQVAYVAQWYNGFARLYANLRDALSQPTSQEGRLKQIAKLQSRLNKLLASRPNKDGEPLKLTQFKNQLRKASLKDKLFVCLKRNTPCDNNQAERGLRSLVLKRKNSFGSVSEAGAKALATAMSMCTNTWRRYPDNYFKALAELK